MRHEVVLFVCGEPACVEAQALRQATTCSHTRTRRTKRQHTYTGLAPSEEAFQQWALMAERSANISPSQRRLAALTNPAAGMASPSAATASLGVESEEPEPRAAAAEGEGPGPAPALGF